MGRVSAFRTYLCKQGLSDRTIREYVRIMLDVEAWCRRRGTTITRMTSDQVLAYCDDRPATYSTRKGIRSTLKHFWGLAERADPPLWAVRMPRKPRGHCRALDEDDAELLDAQAQRRPGCKRALAVLLGMYQALRREEIARLRVEDFAADGWVTVRGKGARTDRLPVHPVVRDALATYLRARDLAGPYLFPGGNGRPHVHPMTIWTWVRELSAELGLPPVPTHRLRHTCLATANDNTHDLRGVQEFARHERPETTAIYTRTTARRLVDIMESITYSRPGPRPLGQRSA